MALVVGVSMAAGDGAAAGGRPGSVLPVAALYFRVKKTLPAPFLRTRKSLHVAASIALAVTPAATTPAPSVLSCHANRACLRRLLWRTLRLYVPVCASQILCSQYHSQPLKFTNLRNSARFGNQYGVLQSITVFPGLFEAITKLKATKTECTYGIRHCGRM
jgi:hypothetical protein